MTVSCARLLSRRRSLALLLFAAVAIAFAPVAAVSRDARVDPAFFQNLPDDNHCLQASMMIVLNALGHPVRWDDVNKATDYQDGLYSWTINGAAVLATYVKGVKLYAGIDYAEFARRGEAFLRETWSANYFNLQQRNASPNFAKEQKAAAAFVGGHTFERRRLGEAEFLALLRDNLIILQTRANLLFPENGNGTHYVVLYADDGDSIWLHDPGLPARPAAKLEKSRVYRAYIGELIAIPHGGRKFGPQ